MRFTRPSKQPDISLGIPADHGLKSLITPSVYEVFVRGCELPESFSELALEHGALAQKPAGAAGPCFLTTEDANQFRTVARQVVGVQAAITIVPHAVE